MLTLAEILINQRLLSLLSHIEGIEKLMYLEPPLPTVMEVGEHHRRSVRVLSKYPKATVENLKRCSAPFLHQLSQKCGTGVYYNDCEVPHEMHPSQVVFPIPQTNFAASLPVGKPMPQPPRLATQQPRRSVVLPETLVLDEQKNEDREIVDLGESKRKHIPPSLEDRASKRCRTLQKRSNLSSEEKVFVEAALALTELGVSNDKSNPKTSCATSPKSVASALPPPPFFLASNSIDLKDAVKSP